MSKDTPYRRRRFEVVATVHDDDFANLAEALLHVADVLDPGGVEISAGPADGEAEVVDR